jgi:hypothetical protein
MASNNLQYVLSLKNQFSSTMQGALKQTQSMDSQMKNLKNSIAGAFVVGGIVSFGKAVVDSLKNYEYFHASIKTMLQGNTLAASALEGQLITLAKTTPFALTEVQDATKQLLAYGFKAGDVVQTMRTLGDVSSGVGSTIGEIAYLYGTLKTSGRVMQVDLRQFAGRGIPIYEVLAKRLKTTTANINTLVHDGKIGFKDIEGAFKDMTKEGGQFFNLMADQSKTVGGKISNLGDTWEQIKVNIGKSQSGILAKTIDWVAKMADGLNLLLGVQNKVDESLKKAGIKQSFTDKLKGNNEGLPSMLNNLDGYQIKLDAITNSTMANDLKKYSLIKQLDQLDKDRQSKKISIPEYNQKQALINGSFDTVKGLNALNNTKENPNIKEGLKGDKEGSSLKSSSMGSGVDVTGQRPQSLTINITKLVESLNVNTTNLKEGAGAIKEAIAKVLLEAVNDVNLMQTA